MIVKTFDEIINEEYNKKENLYLYSGELDDIKDFCIKLMKLVREKTLIETADKADADINILHNLQNCAINLAGIEVYVLKESILQLDKNNIEI